MNRKILVVIFVIVILLAVFIAMNLKNGRGILGVRVGSAGSASLLNQARQEEAKGDILAARASYQKLINDFPNSAEVMNWQRKVEDLNIKLLFSATITPKSVLYEIRPGDTLTKIAKKFNTTIELIKASNNLTSDKIVPGRQIKIWNAPFSILVDKSQNILVLKSEEEVIKTYIVSTGANNSTPVGNFKITNKLMNPTWFKAGTVVPAGSPENILGTRWLGIDVPGYGIHGTTEPESLGKQVTQGCVRMANPEVEELYTIVPVGTEVTIVD